MNLITIQFSINWFNFDQLTNDILCEKIQIAKVKSRVIKYTCYYNQI